MRVKLASVEGSTDGLRFGRGYCARRPFHWTYDLHNDVCRIWRWGKGPASADRDWGLAEHVDPPLAQRTRALVRRAVGLDDARTDAA
jgi:hypothetical protein